MLRFLELANLQLYRRRRPLIGDLTSTREPNKQGSVDIKVLFNYPTNNVQTLVLQGQDTSCPR